MHILKNQKDLVLQNLITGRESHSSTVEDDKLSNASTRTDEYSNGYDWNDGKAPAAWIRQGRFSDLCMLLPPCVSRSTRLLRLEGLTRGPQIGRGISGVVWRGTDPAAAPGCAFAVKEMPLPRGDGDEGRRRGLLNEVRLAYRADHPHVVTCYEVRSLDRPMLFSHCILLSAAQRAGKTMLLRRGAKTAEPNGASFERKMKPNGRARRFGLRGGCARAACPRGKLGVPRL